MARKTTKNEKLTPEEKLVQALVPEAEQPYRVPENWKWVRLGTLGYTNIGLTYKPSDKSDEGTIVLRSCNILDGRMVYDDIVKVSIDVPENKMSKKGDILICARNGSKSLVGKTAIIDDDGMSYGAFMAIFRSPYNKYVYYYLNSHYFRGIIDRDVGTTTINQVTQQIIKELPFPFAPLAEQKRIVDRIESLFSRLDEAKEKAQAVVDGFEDRKAAILHKAFTGELTAEWRERNGYSIAQWESALLKDCSYLIGDGLHGTPIFDKYGQYYFINGNNFSDTRIEIKPDTKTIALGEYEKYKLALFPDLTVFVSINGTLGRTAFYNGEPVILGKSACYVNVNERLNKYFLRYFFTSKEFIDYANSMATGSTIKNLGLKAMRNLILNLPSVSEQVEIVQILDRIMDAEQQAKSAAEQVISQIDTMKKAILARAFRGELGTNDPTEESAEGILSVK